MNYFLSILPDSVMTVSEPVAIFVWGVALMLLSFRKPGGNKVVISQQEAAPQQPESRFAVRVS